MLFKKKDKESKPKKEKKVPVMKVGTHKKTVIALWLVLIASISFGVYKNFTAIDMHTVHEKEVIEQRIVDTNKIENFVKAFAKSYYSWSNTQESIEKRTTAINQYLTKSLQDLNVDTVCMDIPTSSTVTDVKIWEVEATGTDDFTVVYSVDQTVTEGETSIGYTSAYMVVVHVDGDGNLVITQNPTISSIPTKSGYEPKVKESDGTVDAATTEEVTEFLETFFKLYPTATEKELVYYVSGNVLEPVNCDYMFSELVNPKKTQKDDVVFDNVSFTYTGKKEEMAIENVSFKANQGQITAIVGLSGGGKSTIANLISRFWDVTEGSVKIGGVDIRDISEKDLMNHVSFVFQDIFLFKQSIVDNIRMGNPNATEEQVIEAAKAAQCHEFISKLPNGYKTVFGTKGIHLSGGERQRIAIARAIIKDSPIIVLDEATAFSDPENECLIQKAFEKLMQNKTVIIIAHRLSTIRNADKIIVMEKGHLVEEGKHNELVAAGGRYSQMWNHYTEAVDWKISGKAV